MGEKCDVCTVSGVWTEYLNKEYQVEGVQWICEDCRRAIQAHKDKVQQLTSKLNQGFIQKFIKFFKGGFTQK